MCEIKAEIMIFSICHDFCKIDYRKFARENKGFKYILVIIDSFSRFAHTAPLKFKTAEESAAAIDSIFSKFHDLPIFFTKVRRCILLSDPVVIFGYPIS